MIDIKKNNFKNHLKKAFAPTNFLLIIIVLVIFSVVLYNDIDTDKTTYISYSIFKERLAEGKITEIILEKNSPYLWAKTDSEETYKTDYPDMEESKLAIFNSGVPVKHRISTSDKVSSFMNLFGIGVLILIGISIISSFKKGSGMSKAMFEEGIDTNRKKPDIKFKDVAGNEESKDSMAELVYYLKNPDKYKKYGIKAPKGAMIYGPPGTGKTLLAKAVAGEADANFIAVTGSDFVDKFVGNGASRVRHLFTEARKLQPCIIFIDEIDAVGGKRNPGVGNDERHQTLNALLAEIDGFSDDEGIIVLGATNRIDSIDDALLRSGRCDTKIYIGLPDLSARKEIFKVHSKDKPIHKSVDYDALAKMTTYFSGADIENVMNKAGFYAAKLEKEFIDMNDIDKAINHIVAGDEKKDRSGISNDDKKLTAYHEAGHALVAKIKVNATVPRITIIPTTHGAGGYTMINPGEQFYKTKTDIFNQIAISLGGRAAEEIIFGKEFVTTGASSDIKRVTELVQGMIRQYGMSSEFGMLYLGDTNSLDKDILNESRKIVDSIYINTIKFLEQNRNLLDRVATRLLEVETILEKEFDELLEGNVQLSILEDKSIELINTSKNN